MSFLIVCFGSAIRVSNVDDNYVSEGFLYSMEQQKQWSIGLYVEGTSAVNGFQYVVLLQSNSLRNFVFLVGVCCGAIRVSNVMLEASNARRIVSYYIESHKSGYSRRGGTLSQVQIGVFRLAKGSFLCSEY